MCISTGRLDAEIDDEALVVFLAKICQRGRLKFLFCVGLIFAFHMFNNKLLRDTSHRGHKSYPKLWHLDHLTAVFMRMVYLWKVVMCVCCKSLFHIYLHVLWRTYLKQSDSNQRDIVLFYLRKVVI